MYQATVLLMGEEFRTEKPVVRIVDVIINGMASSPNINGMILRGEQ